MVRSQVAEYAAARRACTECGVLRSLKDRRTRRLQTLFGTVEVEAPRFRVCRCVPLAPGARSAVSPVCDLRAALLDQGWREGDAVTATSDGDPALPALVRSATRAPVEHIIDWFRLSMHVRHVEQAFIGLCALDPAQQDPLDPVQVDVERLPPLLWNGCQEEAGEALDRIVGGAEDTAIVNGAAVAPKVGQLVAHCTELHAYIGNNADALIDYGERYRADEPISTSRAESTANHLVNARMSKRRQMRWSPLGAHRVPRSGLLCSTGASASATTLPNPRHNAPGF